MDVLKAFEEVVSHRVEICLSLGEMLLLVVEIALLTELELVGGNQLFQVLEELFEVIVDPLFDIFGDSFHDDIEFVWEQLLAVIELFELMFDVFFECGFVQLYGMTETCGSVTYLPPEDHSIEGNERMLQP